MSSLSKLFGRSKDKSNYANKPVSRAGGQSNAPKNPNGPPPYTVVGGGAADSYYGTGGASFQPSNNPYHQPPPQQYPVPQQPMPQQHYNAPPNPLINPNTLPLPSMNPAPGADDPYSFLRNFDTVLLVDDSGSMACDGRWAQARDALATIIPIITYYDSDGIDLHFLNHPDSPYHHNIKTPAQVMEIFSTVRPTRATPTGTALNRLLKPYIQKYKTVRGDPNKIKPMNIIVITDGVPTDDVESVIVQAAKKLDDLEADLTQVGIQFFQVGDDAAATESLRELDDALADMKNVRDIVDTVPYRGGQLQGDAMLKVVLGAVNKRLDRKRA